MSLDVGFGMICLDTRLAGKPFWDASFCNCFWTYNTLPGLKTEDCLYSFSLPVSEITFCFSELSICDLPLQKVSTELDKNIKYKKIP